MDLRFSPQMHANIFLGHIHKTERLKTPGWYTSLTRMTTENPRISTPPICHVYKLTLLWYFLNACRFIYLKNCLRHLWFVLYLLYFIVQSSRFIMAFSPTISHTLILVVLLFFRFCNAYVYMHMYVCSCVCMQFKFHF